MGGFVIHANAAGTLGRCLESLQASVDEVVALDTGSTDGSAEIARFHGAKVVRVPWEGFGAARSEAVARLTSCDFVFFLDSDEWMELAACARVREWASRTPAKAAYSVRRRNWAVGPQGRYLYRTDHRARLVSHAVARWNRTMIVHEALPGISPVKSDIVIDHHFIGELSLRSSKDDLYALLWAVQHHQRTIRLPEVRAWLSYLGHFLGDGFLRGAAFRGGLSGVIAAHRVALQFLNRYRRAGKRGAEFRALCALHDQAEYSALFRAARDQLFKESLLDQRAE